MVMDANALNDELQRIDEYVQMTRGAIDTATEGNPLGAKQATDAEFVAFFEEMARKDPLWPIALMFVEGGKAEITRYERLRGLRGT